MLTSTASRSDLHELSSIINAKPHYYVELNVYNFWCGELDSLLQSIFTMFGCSYSYFIQGLKLASECTRKHLKTPEIPKISRGSIPPDPLSGGGGGGSRGPTRCLCRLLAQILFILVIFWSYWLFFPSYGSVLASCWRGICTNTSWDT